MINITHVIYDIEYNRYYFRHTEPNLVPTQFGELLFSKGLKWAKQYNAPLIPFTLGYDSSYEIWAIAITHPLDLHKCTLKISENIVRGRIKREAGLLGRDTYSQRTKKSKELADLETDPKLKAKILIPFPDYIISLSYEGI